MVEVDLRKIRGVVSTYNDILEQLEDNNTRIIAEFDELTKYWKDVKQSRLTANFNLERQRILRLEKNVKQHLNIYKRIEAGYEKIGRKVKCNLDNLDLLNNKLDNIITKIGSIINKYNSLGDISFYTRSSLIYNEKNEMVKIQKSFKQIKKDINDKYNQIKTVEKQVATAISNIKVEVIVANNYESED